MTHHSEPVDPQQVGQLRAFGDALAEARPRSAGNDIEETMLRAQRALGPDRLAASAIPDSVKRVIWEELMHVQPVVPVTNQGLRGAADPLDPNPVVIPSLRRTFSLPTRPHDSRLARAVIRWQPAVSLAIVIAFLVGLVGVAYQRGIWNEGGTPEPQAGVSQIAPGPGDFPETPVASSECVPHGADRLSAEELESMSLSDWPLRSYVPVRAIDPEIGQAALDTYLGWTACQVQFVYSENTPDRYASDEMLSYYSDRWRYLVLSATFEDDRMEERHEYWSRDVGQELVASFPLPLNRPRVVFDFGTYPNTRSTDAFSPGDVFQLPDGRYGVVTGTISTEMLQNGPALAPYDSWLNFIAFLEVDGTLYIDEMFPFCVGEEVLTALDGEVWATPLADDMNENKNVITQCR